MRNESIQELETVDVTNFWFMAKEHYLELIIGKQGAVILDVGCGTGRNMVPFIHRGHKVYGIDVNESALFFSKEKGYEIIKADLEQNDIPSIDQVPDYITALDFLEHLENPVNALSNLKKISGKDTQLIITVPSYQMLFSDWDSAMGHVKRYNPSMLCDELNESGWIITQITYIHLLPLIPAFLSRKILTPVKRKLKHSASCDDTSGKFFNPSPNINKLLYLFYYPEFYLFQKRIPLPLGLSVLAIAVPAKRKDDGA